MKKVYFSMTTHPNMNYDRSLRSVIWEQFPKLYRLYLNYLRDNPPLKSHMQLPPQTLLSLKQCAPDVIELAQAIRAEGRLKFMGTFFSESIAQCQDDMSVLDAAELGCGIAAAELDAELEGFFLQEIAYTPQLPYVIEKLGVQWTIIRDWEDSLQPFWAEGLDGTRCVAVPLLEHAQHQRIRKNPDSIPDNALLITHCDMEIPFAIKRLHDLETYLREECGFDTEWCFVSDYIEKVGVHAHKRPTPCTNKPEDPPASPSFSRWCSDHLSMRVHEATLSAMEARRTACLATFGRDTPSSSAVPEIPASRPHTTWEVENPWTYPELVEQFGGTDAPFRRMAMLIAWGCNSDGRGWYPLLERRLERLDSFREAELIAGALTRSILDPAGAPGPGLAAVNAHGVPAVAWHTLLAPEPLALLDSAGRDTVQLLRRNGVEWEHHVRVDVPPYSACGLRKRRSRRSPAQETTGNAVANGSLTVEFADGTLTISRPARPDMTLRLDPFRIHVKCLDTELRTPQPEGDWRVTTVSGEFPRLIARRQIDYHIHFQAEYTLDGDRVFADWRFYFTYPTLVDSLDDFDAGGPKTDFTPGGLCASLATGIPGDVWYDVPFGVIRHPNSEESFVPPLTHAFVVGETGGAAMVSQSGSQSFKVHGADGRVGICMGKSNTSGGRRKLLHWAGDDIGDYGSDTEWYKEFFEGELHHRFVVLTFDGDWRDRALPNVCRALGRGPEMLDCIELRLDEACLAEITPANIRLAGLEPDTGRIVLCEMCGRETAYRLRIGNIERRGRISPFGIVEVR
ncbi:MAG: hypothetical protein GXP31_15610 [Kiritimatiellaeota bacterium]|nr:hypothetical protein [Kiritimatiellota bacterium]